MIVITVARKPLSEGSVAANVLKHGTGGLNIGGCRVGCDTRTYSGSGSSPQKLVNHGPGDTGVGMLDGSGKDLEFTVTGRWPANLILEHLPECRCIGARKIRGNRVDTRPEGDGGREDKSQWRFRPTEATRRGYSDESGQETVESWECVPGCPVAELDSQSGERPGSHDHTINPRKSKTLVVFGKMGEPSLDRTGFGDKGGASRFFKQVQSKQAPVDTTLATFHFHEEEADDARLSLESSGVTCTARWGLELDKWGKGEVVQTPWGQEVCIFAIDRHLGIEQHPHKALITERVRQGIGDGPFELLYLHASVVKSP